MNTLTNSFKINRADVLRLTWQMVKAGKLTFGEAMKKAWATIRLTAEMTQKPTGFHYVKDDGSTRFAIGLYSVTSTKPTSPLVVRYFDTVANGLRSFRADRLIVA